MKSQYRDPWAVMSLSVMGLGNNDAMVTEAQRKDRGEEEESHNIARGWAMRALKSWKEL